VAIAAASFASRHREIWRKLAKKINQKWPDGAGGEKSEAPSAKPGATSWLWLLLTIIKRLAVPAGGNGGCSNRLSVSKKLYHAPVTAAKGRLLIHSVAAS